MKFVFVFTLFYSYCFNGFSFEVPKTCLLDKSSQKDCVQCKQTTPKIMDLGKLQKLANEQLVPLTALGLYSDKAKKLRASNIVIKNQLASIFRTLRDKGKEPTFQEGQKRIKKIQESFDQLTVLSKEANHLERQHNICMNNCSAVQKLEILDDIGKIQKLKSMVLIKEPLLANKNFEELYTKMDDQFADTEDMFSNKIFEEKLYQATFDNLQNIIARENEYARFEDDAKKPFLRLENNDNIKKYNDDLMNRFPLISEGIIQDISINEASQNPVNNSACYLTQLFKTYSQRKEYKEIATDVTLFALPFFLGPIGRASEFTIELMMGERLANYGLKTIEASKSMKLTNISINAGVGIADLQKLHAEINECKNKEVTFLSSASNENLDQLNECKEKVSNEILMAEISAIPLLKTHISMSALKKIQIIPPALSKRVSLITKDFGKGKNKVIKDEINAILKIVKDEKKSLENLPTSVINQKENIKAFKSTHTISLDSKAPISIAPKDLVEFQKTIGKDTMELLYVPGADVPHLPESIKRVGHVAIRIGDKVYHQTGGSGFKIEKFEDFLYKTKQNYKVYGQVIEVSEKEKAVMESYFKKMYDKQLPYSFLANNCSQTICRSMELADMKSTNAVIARDPFLTQLKISRNERVVMKTSYNDDKDLSLKDLNMATVKNRLAFYGVPLVSTGSVAGAGYEAVDLVVEYLNQIKETK
ncbi:MAG: hypothetical protein H7281_06455 [Bacteriovorax sp.]|nr:hypothetical protein [Bacteriovorax sp.]